MNEKSITRRRLKMNFKVQTDLSKNNIAVHRPSTDINWQRKKIKEKMS